MATAAMTFVEQGQLQLDHLVRRYLPDFQGGGKESIRIIHLLTHTSGLPDMLPNNVELRRAHAPLSEFMRYVYDVDLVADPQQIRVERGVDRRRQVRGEIILITVMDDGRHPQVLDIDPGLLVVRAGTEAQKADPDRPGQRAVLAGPARVRRRHGGRALHRHALRGAGRLGRARSE